MDLLLSRAAASVAALGLLLSVGCRSDDLCSRAVDHITFAPMPVEARDEISRGERAAMEAVAAASRRACRSEGLTQAQADCIFAVKTIDDLLLELPLCEAIAENQPSWLVLPSAAEREQIRALRAGEADEP